MHEAAFVHLLIRHQLQRLRDARAKAAARQRGVPCSQLQADIPPGRVGGAGVVVGEGGQLAGGRQPRAQRGAPQAAVRQPHQAGHIIFPAIHAKTAHASPPRLLYKPVAEALRAPAQCFFRGTKGEPPSAGHRAKHATGSTARGAQCWRACSPSTQRRACGGRLRTLSRLLLCVTEATKAAHAMRR